MKSFLLSLMLLLSPLSLEAGCELTVISDNCPIYETASFSSTIIETAVHGDKLEFIEQAGNFYFVNFGEISGYVSMENIGQVQPPQDIILTYNATTLTDSPIYNPNNNEVIATIKKGTRVLLYEGYDKKSDFLAVKFNIDGKVMIGRIATENVKPDGVNVALIVSISAIVALVSIIFILFGITKKKSKTGTKN